MDVSVYLPLYLGIALAAATPLMARMLPPRTGVWCLTAAAVTAAISWVVSLGMLSFTGLGRIAFVADEGHWSATIWRRMDPVDVWTARIAGTVLVGCAVLFTIALMRELAARRAIGRITLRLPTPEMVVFVDDEAPHAYSVGGRRPRIVISGGLLRAMNMAERRAVLAHENAHIRHRHGDHLTIVRLAAAVNPLLRAFVPAGELAVERWADEETAAHLGDRTLVARTLLRAALASADHGRSGRPFGALSHTSGDVGRRVRALMQAPPRPQRSMTVATTVLLIATMCASIVAATNIDRMLHAAALHGRSPSAEHGVSSSIDGTTRYEPGRSS